MARFIFLFTAVLGLGGCTATNDSGVTLHRKPDLSGVVLGSPIAQVTGLKKPVKKEPMTDGAHQGAELWFYEWDLPDDGVNNRMFTTVVVKDGVIVSYREDTADKWEQDVQLHRSAKLDSALEDVSSLKATAARYQRVASLRENSNAIPQGETLELLMERTRFISAANQQATSVGGPVAPVSSPLPGTSIVLPAPSSSPAPVAAVVEVAPPKKTLRELEAEELEIRKDSSLTKKERMRRLQEVWKLQREVMAEGTLAEN